MVSATTNYCTMQLSKKCRKKQGELPLTDFYTASNLTFYNNGKFNICKHCLKEYLYDEQEINVIRLKNILRIFDLPFLEKEFTSAVNGKNETIGTYIKNIMLNHKGETWLDGDLVQDSNKTTDTSFKPSKNLELVKKWGRGFSDDDLNWLEDDYIEWTTENDCRKLSAKKLIKMICIKELEIRKAIEDGLPTDKLEKSLLELMNNSNLTPKTMGASTDDDSSKTYGEFIRDIERFRPCEYFDDKEIYEDVDGIGQYFKDFVLRPLRNLVTGSRDFVGKYSITPNKSFDSEGGGADEK